MQRTRIKICGIKEPEQAIAAADAGADYIGLVFVEKSPRYVSVEQAKAVAQSLPEHVERVGLFVDQPATEINVISHKVGLTTLQLHGHETIDALDQLDRVKILKALPFSEGAFEEAAPWNADPRVTALLLDTPPTGELTGGSGVAFDWDQLAQTKEHFQKPIFLAGGLTPDNVGEAIRTVRPYAVDVSSGVESSRGVKDVGLIKAFCDAVRQADSELSQQ